MPADVESEELFRIRKCVEIQMCICYVRNRPWLGFMLLRHMRAAKGKPMVGYHRPKPQNGSFHSHNSDQHMIAYLLLSSVTSLFFCFFFFPESAGI